ncbi:calmodulin-A isoform X2 [Hydra vulgaris]|uniref:Calmodulin-A isoform X2 n=1 Tax=Hydra vulgaris TaxID=6087 RepID=A0ABM4C216_HYDVU
MNEMKFNKEDLGQLKDVFYYFDTKKTGYITSKQLATSLRCLKPKPLEKDVEEMVISVNEEKKGKLNFDEYLFVVSQVIKKVKRRNRSVKRQGSCEKNISEAQLQDLKDSFAMFDLNGDGKISMEELDVVMKNLGHETSKEEIDTCLKEIDSDLDGELSFQEFITLMTRKLSNKAVSQELKEVFDFFDEDGNGSISSDELRDIMLKFGEDLTEEEIAEMIVEADFNGDGNIDYQEFVKMMSFVT